MFDPLSKDRFDSLTSSFVSRQPEAARELLARLRNGSLNEAQREEAEEYCRTMLDEHEERSRDGELPSVKWILEYLEYSDLRHHADYSDLYDELTLRLPEIAENQARVLAKRIEVGSALIERRTNELTELVRGHELDPAQITTNQSLHSTLVCKLAEDQF